MVYQLVDIGVCNNFNVLLFLGTLNLLSLVIGIWIAMKDIKMGVFYYGLGKA